MSSRSQKILDISYKQLGIKTPVVNQSNKAMRAEGLPLHPSPTPLGLQPDFQNLLLRILFTDVKRKKPVRTRTVDDDVSSIAESEFGILNPEFVESHVKCASWLNNKNYLKELQTKSTAIIIAPTVLTPVKTGIPSHLVAYSPSTSTSTGLSDSSKLPGKENQQGAQVLPTKRALTLGVGHANYSSTERDKTGSGPMAKPLEKSASKLIANSSSGKDASELLVTLSKKSDSEQLVESSDKERISDVVGTPSPQGSKRSLEQSDTFAVPSSKRRSLETAVNQPKNTQSAKPAAPQLSPYTMLKMKIMQENAQLFKKMHGLEIPSSEIVFCMEQNEDKEGDKDKNQDKEKDLGEENSSASSDSYSPSSPSSTSSLSSRSLSPQSERKVTRSAARTLERKPSQVRKGLQFGSTNTASQSCSFANPMATESQGQTHAQSPDGGGKNDAKGGQGSTKAAVTLKNDKPVSNKEKPAPSKKPMPVPTIIKTLPAATKNSLPAPAKKPMPAQRKLNSVRETLPTTGKAAGSQRVNQLFGCTSTVTETSCSANLVDQSADDTGSVNEANHEGSTNDGDQIDEQAHFDTADPLSDDDLQDLMVNNKPPSQKALKTERKLKRDSGQEYVTPSGKIVSKRSPKPIHTCAKLKCKENISKEAAVELCDKFWSLGSHNKQTQYVASLVEARRPVRRRVRDDDSGKNRKVTYLYFLEVDGQKHQVCKTTFLSTLCLSETFVRNVSEKKHAAPGGIVSEDARGNHKPKHILPEERKQAVMAHIDSFPSYVSHYSRSQTKSLYFPSNLSYKKMYNLYIQGENSPYVSYSVYKKLAKRTGKKFKKPSKDTCGRCDKLKIQINISGGESKKAAEIELELHQRKAEEAYAVKRRLKKEAATSDNMAVLVYDLEQCLPTPMLRCGESYYTRQLNTFNLTVYDTKTKLTYCYMWNEAEGGRSANAIASCLLRHILEFVPEGVERLLLFSDACTSQNRNSHISAMYFVALQEHTSLKTVEHMFLVPGHTHMEPDNKHSVIERYKKKLEKVSVPQEWYDAVKAAGQQSVNDDFPDGKFIVILMKDNFYDFSALLKGPLVKREKTTQNEKFSWLDTFVFLYTKERLGIVQVKNSHNPAALFNDLSFLRIGGKSATLPTLSTLLKKCFTRPQPITAQKKRDLLKLLPYLDSEHHAFYHALTTDETFVEDTDPDLPEED